MARKRSYGVSAGWFMYEDRYRFGAPSREAIELLNSVLVNHRTNTQVQEIMKDALQAAKQRQELEEFLDE